MDTLNESTDKVAEQPNNVLPFPNKPQKIANHEDIKILIEEILRVSLETKNLDAKANEINHSKTERGGNMSDSPSKDWIDKNNSVLDNKIEMEKVKAEAKFDKMVSNSDAKFERLFSELKFESERNSFKIDSTSLKFDASIARLETNITRWMLGILFSILGLGFAVWRSAQPNHDPQQTPPTSQTAKQTPSASAGTP